MHLISKRYFDNGGKFSAGMALRFLYLASFLKIANGGCNEACNRSVDDLLVWIKNGYDGSVRPNSTGKDR